MSTPQQRMDDLREETISALTPQLTEDQSQVVFGAGDPASPLMIVGEAPGPQEDKEGVPFVGRSGQLLSSLLEQVGLSRDDLWISNVVKVWPTNRSGNSLRTRAPRAAERKASFPFFEREVALIQPKAILCLGGTAAKQLIDNKFKITEERGEWREGLQDVPTIATYHPSYLLRMQGIDPERAAEMEQEFVGDVRRAAERAGLLS